MRRRAASDAAPRGPAPAPGRRAPACGGAAVQARRGLAAGLAAAGLLAAPGSAGDRSITGSISQQFIADTNVQLEEGDEASLGSITTLSLAYVDRTPTSTFSLGTGLNFSAFTNDDQNDGISGLFPRLNGAYSVRRPTQTLSVNFSGSITPVDFLSRTDILLPGAPDFPDEPGFPDPDDEDVIDDEETPTEPDPEAPTPDPLETTTRTTRDDALRVSFGAGVSWSQTISSAESVNFGANASRLDFIDGDDSLVPNTAFGVNGGWNRRLAADATAGLTAGASLFFSDGVDNRQTYTLRIGPSASWQRTARETFSITLGPSFNHTSVDRQLAGGGTRSEEESSVSVAGNAGFSFAGDVDRINVGLSQSVLPDDDGEIVNTTSLTVGWGRRLSQAAQLNWTAGAVYRSDLFGGGGAVDDRIDYRTSLGWSYRVNPRNSANLGVDASRDDDGAGDARIVTGLRAGWSYVIAPRTNANLAYDLRYETDEEIFSHRVGLTLSHGFTLLP